MLRFKIYGSSVRMKLDNAVKVLVQDETTYDDGYNDGHAIGYGEGYTAGQVDTAGQVEAGLDEIIALQESYIAQSPHPVSEVEE